jgi:hypothetical protein
MRRLWIVSGFPLALLLLAGSTANAAGFTIRDDIVVNVTPGALANFELGGKSAVQVIKSGHFSMRFDGDATCAATPTSGCAAAINGGVIVLNDLNGVEITVNLPIGSEDDTIDITSPSAFLVGPRAVVRGGIGFGAPTSMRTTSFGRLFGTVVGKSHNGDGNSAPGTLAGSDLQLSYQLLPTQEFSVDGTLPISVSVGDGTLSGTISFLASGITPFEVSPPIAFAGPNQTVQCGQAVTLDGSESFDQLGQDDIDSYQWFLGNTLSGSGPVVQLSLPVGSHAVTLVVTGKTGAQTHVSTNVVVQLSAPSFGTAPSAQVTQSCATDASAVPISVPAAQACGQDVPVKGTVTSFNGTPRSIPLVNGTVNLPPGTGTVEFTATNAEGVTTTVTQALTVLSPSTFLGSQGVSVGNGSTVNGTIYAGAGGQTFLQNDATTREVFSRSHVVLQDRVSVPLIETNAGVTPGNNDHIGQTINALPFLSQFPSVSATSSGTQTVTVNPTPEAGDVLPLPPGQYGAVTVFPRGKLILSSGTYVFASLDLEPQAQLVTPSAQSETAQLFVHNSVIYRGTTNTASGQLAPLYLAYLGSNTLTIESPFTGTIIAPNAQLTLQSLNGQGVYTGEFFAAQLSLSPHTTVNSNPFTCK